MDIKKDPIKEPNEGVWEGGWDMKVDLKKKGEKKVLVMVKRNKGEEKKKTEGVR